MVFRTPHDEQVRAFVVRSPFLLGAEVKKLVAADEEAVAVRPVAFDALVKQVDLEAMPGAFQGDAVLVTQFECCERLQLNLRDSG
ncbi:MAG: hypothetical protein RMM31_00810 [Anaerolineae bacterium]|nr:hypothetical protein [Thermoflexales bacterium]MDW8394765.1 hypothetical protein [Anaerolineae bacterium]